MAAVVLRRPARREALHRALLDGHALQQRPQLSYHLRARSPDITTDSSNPAISRRELERTITCKLRMR